jgi:hypothetical protein
MKIKININPNEDGKDEGASARNVQVFVDGKDIANRLISIHTDIDVHSVPIVTMQVSPTSLEVEGDFERWAIEEVPFPRIDDARKALSGG